MSNYIEPVPSPRFLAPQTHSFYAKRAHDLAEELAYLRQEVDRVIEAAYRSKPNVSISPYLSSLEDLESRIIDLTRAAKNQEETLPSMLEATRAAYEQAAKSYRAQLNASYETLVPQVDQTLDQLDDIQSKAHTLLQRAKRSFHELNDTFEPAQPQASLRRRAPLQMKPLDFSDEEEDVVSEAGSDSIPQAHPCEEIQTAFCQRVNKPKCLRKLLIASLVANGFLLISLLLAKHSCNSCSLS